MNVFVTGGAGFIGSVLVKSLLEKENQVTIFDDFSNSSEKKILPLIEKGAKLVKGDIRDVELLKKSIVNCDIVVHLAAKIDVEKSIKNPEITNEVNVTGTVNVLRACVENKIKNVIALSSAAVFGNPTNLPLTEESKTNPSSPYGASKLAMEHYMHDFSHSYEINSLILRVFNVYGPGQSDAYAGVISKFLYNISQNKPLVIFGDGSNTRDFVSVNDVIAVINNSIDNIEGKKGNSYNIASGKHISIKELAELMISISGKKLEIKYEPAKKGEIAHSQTLIELAKQDLGFLPSVELKDGLKKLFEISCNIF